MSVQGLTGVTPTRRRVMLLTDDLQQGGLARVVLTLAEELHRRGHRVTVVAEATGELWEELPPGVDRRLAPSRASLLGGLVYFFWLARLVRGGEFDVVHAHQRGVALQARVARAFTRVRVVEHVHNTFRVGRSAFLSFRGDRLIACGSSVASMLEKDFGRSEARVVTIANAVPDLPAEERTLPPTSRRSGPPTLLVPARVSEQKDPHRFIDVMERLNARGLVANAVWVGGGELLDECRAEVRRRRIEGVDFVGPRSSILGSLQEADLVLLTSRWEGLPLVLLEAAAMGRGMVVPRVGSCADVVEDGVNGRLFDGEAAPEVIASVIRDCLDPGVIASMGAASRFAFTSRFSVEDQVARVEAVYDDVLR